MSAESGGRKTEDRPERAWILDCEGFRVERRGVVVGRVLSPLYDFSARWDCPRALAVKSPSGLVEVRLEDVQTVEPVAGRILLRPDR